MKEPMPPCLGCAKRTAENPDLGIHDCHAACEIYQKYKKDHTEWSKAVFAKRMDDVELNEVEKLRFKKYIIAKRKGRI